MMMIYLLMSQCP